MPDSSDLTDDLVQRLRVKDDKYTEFWAQKLMDEAADRIEAVEAEAVALRVECDRLAALIEDIQKLCLKSWDISDVLVLIEEAKRSLK